jgi:hypothetical protein
VVCGGVFNQTQGEFVSPGYPLAYKNNLRCDYKIAMPSTDYVVIEFVAPFELEQSKKQILKTHYYVEYLKLYWTIHWMNYGEL